MHASWEADSLAVILLALRRLRRGERVFLVCSDAGWGVL